MILMNWVQNNNGCFTAYEIRIKRARTARFLRGQLANTMWRVYCHEQISRSLYESLAALATDKTMRDIFLGLAESEKRHLIRRADMLARLGADAPDNCHTIWVRSWQRFLLSCGPEFVLAYIEWIKRRDLQCQLKLVSDIRAFQEEASR